MPIVAVVVGIIVAIYAPEFLSAYFDIATGTLASVVATGALAGAASGAIMTGTIEGTLKGAAFGAVSAGIANGIGAVGENIASSWGVGAAKTAKALLHAISRSAITKAQGGKWSAGFWSGFASSALAPIASNADSTPGKIAMSAIIGGTVSEIGGGKFANGAVTGAFVMMYNEMAHKVHADKANSESLKKIYTEIQKVKNMNLDEFNQYVKYGINKITTTEDFLIAKNHVLGELNIMNVQHASVVVLNNSGIKTVWSGIVKAIGFYESKNYYIGYTCMGSASDCGVSGVYYDK